MLPNKKRFLLIVSLFTFLLFAVVIIWYFNLGYIQERTVEISSSLSNKSFVVQDLSQEELKNLANIPILLNLETSLQPTSSQVQERLQKSNTVLFYQGNPLDDTGRTVLLGTKQNISSFITGLGGDTMNFEVSPATISADLLNYIAKNMKNTVITRKPNTFGGKIIMHDVWREAGVFKSWVKISSSQDLYLRLSVPQRNQDFIVRINRQKGSCYPFNASILTNLAVQDVSSNSENAVLNELGTVTSWSEKDLARIIKPGDLLEINNQQLNSLLQDRLAQISSRDNLGVVCADTLIINRFDGKSRLEKELSRPIPDSQF